MARKRRGSSAFPFAPLPPPPPPPKMTATKSAPLSNLTQYWLPELPHELILEILPRLPVKSLYRFRCVCKSWDSLLYDLKFLKKHANLALHKFLVNSRPIFLKSFQVSDLLLDKPGTNPESLRFPLSTKQYVRIIGSCNGMICLNAFNRGNEDIYFWNPAAKQSIKLPTTFPVTDYNVFGFGFDDTTNEFKLVRVIHVETSSHELSRKFRVEIHGMWDATGRQIGLLPFGFPYTRNEGVYLNGAVHIVTIRGERSVIDGVTTKKIVWSIVALDLATETFRQLPQPDFEDGVFKSEEHNTNLYAVGECLAVVRSYKDSHGDVWIMKEHGVKESWFKLAKFPFVMVPASPFMWRLKPVYYYEKTGKVLILIRDELVLYNTKDKSFRPLKLHGVNLQAKFYVQIKSHMDTLLTPSVMKLLRGEPSQSNQVD